MYSVAWRYISIREVFLITAALLPVTGVLFGMRLLLPAEHLFFRMPLSVIALEFLLGLVGTTGVRMARRLAHERTHRGALNNVGKPIRKNVLLIGAGDAGNLVVKELRQRPDLGLNVVGFIDDDRKKFLSAMQGVRVLGDTSRLAEIARKKRVDEAIITIANASSKDIRRIQEACEGAKIKVRIVPGLFELFDDEVKIMKIRDINIEDVLGRSVVQFESHRQEIASHYRNKRIMVTGAGGSIGSELCRQLAGLKPGELVMLDKDEFSIYGIDGRMRQEFPEVKAVPLIGDVRSRSRLVPIFERFRPQIIFHAAAHKHVPLMEANIAEAISNNILGTKVTAELAARYGVENFIFISTDKAVNPTSVMGATKKIGEILIQELASASATRFSCVRFGNVLGSRGSVVPLFREQIAQGGPLTITHPDVRRYFMSISEAVQLIIQAGTIGDRGEILRPRYGRADPRPGPRPGPRQIVRVRRGRVRVQVHRAPARREALRGDPGRRRKGQGDRVRQDLCRAPDRGRRPPIFRNADDAPRGGGGGGRKERPPVTQGHGHWLSTTRREGPPSPGAGRLRLTPG